MSAIAFLTAVALAKACSEGRFLNLTIMKKLERSEMKNLKGGLEAPPPDGEGRVCDVDSQCNVNCRCYRNNPGDILKTCHCSHIIFPE